MRLEEYLLKNQITAPQFAVMIGVHHTMVYRWLKGTASPRLTKAFEIEKATQGQVTVADMRGGYVVPR